MNRKFHKRTKQLRSSYINIYKPHFSQPIMEVSEDLIITKHSDLYTGAEFLCNALAQSGVTHVYGGHGGAVVPIIDAIVAHPSLTWVRIWCHGSFVKPNMLGINIVDD